MSGSLCNTVVETEAPKLVPPATALHFSRVRVTVISNSDDSRAQFALASLLDAAMLLADAKVDCIAWAGTSGSWLGFEQDRKLAEAIAGRTGVPATTALLAINAELEHQEIGRIGLVTPYVAALESQIVANYAAIGVETAAAVRLDLTQNTDYAVVTPARIAEMCRDVARARPNAILVMCTNLRGAPVAASLTAELGIPVIDLVECTIRHCLVDFRPYTYFDWEIDPCGRCRHARE